MKLKVVKKLKTKGTILQIVLIILMVTILNIGIFFSSIIENSRSIQRIKELDENRLLELTIIRYYKETIVNSILFSDEITVGKYQIYYTVDDLGSYYYIVTTVTTNENEYSFELEIDLEKLLITSFEYR
ncbi:hypothetical protein [Thomasclavelia sp.]|uniref:hypothetical protein n=1 Tax=Thomasclavelia sp. TaxID=3025757 RepID=UPI0025D16610|nr:hypothetical protein [Thomasclavelia sp.]